MPALLATEATPLFAVRSLARSGTLYAILDACDAPAVPPKVTELGDHTAVSLYRGGPQQEYADFAPYLVACDEDTFDWLLATLWGEPWGIFLTSAVPLPDLRTHFRNFLVVTNPQNEQLYFRFYDPRVLPEYCNTCTASELKDFYGPVKSFGISDDSRGVIWQRMANAQEAWAAENPSTNPRPRIVFNLPAAGT